MNYTYKYKITKKHINICKHINQIPFKSGYIPTGQNDSQIFTVSFCGIKVWVDPMTVFSFTNRGFIQINSEWGKYLDMVFEYINNTTLRI